METFSITYCFVLLCLFLAALLDALGASVQRALAAGLGSHFLARLLLCEMSVSVVRFHGAWAVFRYSGYRRESYQPSSSQGKPSRPRRGPCSASSGPLRAWPCRLEISIVSSHGGATWRGCKQQNRRGRRNLTFSVSTTHDEFVDRRTAENARRICRESRAEKLVVQRASGSWQIVSPRKKRPPKASPKSWAVRRLQGLVCLPNRARLNDPCRSSCYLKPNRHYLETVSPSPPISNRRVDSLRFSFFASSQLFPSCLNLEDY